MWQELAEYVSQLSVLQACMEKGNAQGEFDLCTYWDSLEKHGGFSVVEQYSASVNQALDEHGEVLSVAEAMVTVALFLRRCVACCGFPHSMIPDMDITQLQWTCCARQSKSSRDRD